MRGTKPRIFLFGTIYNHFDVVMVEPIAVLLGSASMRIGCYICRILSLGTYMELPVVAFSIEILRSNMVLLDSFSDAPHSASFHLSN